MSKLEEAGKNWHRTNAQEICDRRKRDTVHN